MLPFIFIVYCIFLLIFGFGIARKASNLDQFIVANRSLSTHAATFTIFSTWFGGGSVVGVAAAAYSSGLSGVIADPFAAGAALLIAGWFYSKRLHQTGGITITDIIKQNFGRRLELLCSVLIVPAYLGWLSALLLALGQVVSDVFSVTLEYGVVASAILVCSYTSIGGIQSLVKTDTVNGVVLILGVGLLAYALLDSYWAQPEILEKIPSSSLNIVENNSVWGWMAFAGQWTLYGLGSVVGQDLAQRIFACKSKEVAKTSCLTAGGFYILVCSIPILVGLFSVVLYQDVANNDEILLVFAKNRMGPIAYELFLLGLFAVVLSSADSAALASAALFSQNIFKPKTKSQQLKVARIILVLSCLLACLVGLWIQDIYKVMVHGTTFLSMTIFVPVTFSLFRIPLSNKVAWAAIVSGITVWLFLLLYLLDAGFLDTDKCLYVANFCGFVTNLLIYLFSVVPRKMGRSD